MYVPKHFAEHDLGRLHEAIEQFSFATVISGGNGLEASHLPLLLDREAGAQGTLLGHMARANPQWERANGQEVLAIFQGPHAYISPRWYGATNVVPTWNYVAIHAYGPFEVIDNPQTPLALARQIVEHYEAAFDEPWQLSASLELLDELTRQIVAFRIPITRIEGKWKLSQNHPLARRKQVIAGLRELGGDTARQVAELMEGKLG